MVKVFSSGAVIGALMLTEFVKGTEVDIIKLSDGLPVDLPLSSNLDSTKLLQSRR